MATSTSSTFASNTAQILLRLGVDLSKFSGCDLNIHTPIDGSLLAQVRIDTLDEVRAKIGHAHDAFLRWRDVPGPARGDLVRVFGDELRANKEPLAELVTIECGKILEEGRGEVQEMIDICDFAVGISRQLYGLTIASERPMHVMQETWHPLGVVGVISAFNFPVAVWSWNSALAFVCGDTVVWKPSEKTPLTALACQALLVRAATKCGVDPAISQVILGAREVGEILVDDARVPLISATGSTRMGREIGPKIAARFGRSLLELGGNNAMIISDKADLDVALPSILFGSVGTAGQRCTSTRRVIAHKAIADTLHAKLATAYKGLRSKIGNPLSPSTLIGPLIDEMSFDSFQKSLAQARADGGEVVGGESFPSDGGYYVEPALVRMLKQTGVVFHETFAPLTYFLTYETLEEAIALHNAVPQGLSGAIMTTDVREAELYKKYSDCGIANVNIGTSGAEIGGAFGGEKETGGGRESGSDSWKAYMRRQTSTTYFGRSAPALAQGVRFDAE